MRKLLVIFICFLGTAGLSETEGMKKYKDAANFMTYLVVGGASEEFAQRTFKTFYANQVKSPDWMFDHFLMFIYWSYGQYRNHVTTPPFSLNPTGKVAATAERHICTSEVVERLWD